jgi:L-erythro-3,5-diaminohexanoate dehydrogenase
VIAVESHEPYALELEGLRVCNAVVRADARDPIATRGSVLARTEGREADLVLSCVNTGGTELASILCARDRGVVYFFAMSTSFTRAALGAEGVGKDVDLFIGNGYARGHAEHTLAMLREMPLVRALFERRYA